MTEPRWVAKRFPRDGGSAANGIRELLGAPNMDRLAVLVRESAQNSWDAGDHDRVDFTVRLETLRGERLDAWRRVMLDGEHLDQFGLADCLARNEVHLLTVSDRGTSGLGGPLSGEEPTPAGESEDFVNFVRNVGVARDKTHGGGTYGFGKASFFQVAGSDMVLIDSRCRYQGRLQRRLIGSALGPAFAADKKFTGRHFWGSEEDGIADPLLDAEADRVGNELGLPGFSGDATGTDITIVGAQLGENDDGEPRTLHQAADFIAGAAAWYLWPNMVDRGDGPRLSVHVTLEGKPVEVPDPSRHPRLRHFVEALRLLDEGAGIDCHRRTPPINVGAFAHAVGPASPAPQPAADAAAPFSGNAHHCARMRLVELVVDYVEGPLLPDSIAEYGAVFRAHEDVDDLLAEAEPPTHDDWPLKGLTGTHRGVVQKVGTFVREQLEGVVPSVSQESPGQMIPLGALADYLARSLPAGAGFGASVKPTRPSTSSRRASRPYRITSGPLLETRPTVRVVATVDFDDLPQAATFRGVASASTAVGRERSTPTGAPTPIVEGWRSSSGELRKGDLLRLEPNDDRTWILSVIPAADTTTAVTIVSEDPTT